MILNLDNGDYIKITILKNNKGTYEYYSDGVLIGVYNPSVMKDSKFIEVDLQRINTVENELSAESKDEIKQIIDEVKEKINNIELEQIEEEAKENKLIVEYLEENELEEKRIKSITVKDLDEQTKEKEESEENKSAEDEELDEPKETNITQKDVNIKQQVDLDERATDVENLRKWLGGNIPHEFQKIGVIESYQMSQMKDENGKKMDNPSTIYALVVIGKNGQVEPLKKYIPQLEQNNASGDNPIESKYQIDTNGNVEKDAVLSEYKIGNKILQLDKDFGDKFEVNIGKYGPFTNNLVTHEMRGQDTQFATGIEQRKVAMGHYESGVYGTERSAQEAQEHEDAGCNPEELTTQEIDGDPNTGHTHISEEKIDEYVKKIMENPEISEVFTEGEVRERLQDNIGNDEKIKEGESIEDIIKATEQELGEDASHYPTREKR